jgi:hypothetical protein
MEPVTIAALGTAGAVLLGLRLRAMSIAKKTGGSLTLSDRQKIAIQKPLTPAVEEVLKTRGPAPDAATLNSLKIQQDAGTLNVADLLKGTNGTVFVKTSPPGGSVPDSILTQIISGDNLTVDGPSAGIAILGNVLFVAKGPVDMSTRTVLASTVDPRFPDGQPAVTIPVAAITGISP